MGSDGTKRFHFDNTYWLEPQQYEHFSLIQFGDISCKAKYLLKEHKQVCYEISYIVSGKGWFAANGHRYEVEEGDIFIGAPGDLHSGGADAIDPYRFVYFAFRFHPDRDREEREHPFLSIQHGFDHKTSPLRRDRYGLNVPFLNALKEIRNRTRHSRLMLETYLNQIIVLVHRNFFSEWDPAYPLGPEHNEAKDTVYDVVSYIESHIMTLHDLTDVAKALNYSYSYLSHLFTEETGISLRSFYTRKKMQKSIELLHSRAYSITQVANIMGYQSIHSFSRAFRKSAGISPTDYIRLYVTPNVNPE